MGDLANNVGRQEKPGFAWENKVGPAAHWAIPQAQTPSPRQATSRGWAQGDKATVPAPLSWVRSFPSRSPDSCTPPRLRTGKSLLWTQGTGSALYCPYHCDSILAFFTHPSPQDQAVFLELPSPGCPRTLRPSLATAVALPCGLRPPPVTPGSARGPAPGTARGRTHSPLQPAHSEGPRGAQAAALTHIDEAHDQVGAAQAPLRGRTVLVVVAGHGVVQVQHEERRGRGQPGGGGWRAGPGPPGQPEHSQDLALNVPALAGAQTPLGTAGPGSRAGAAPAQRAQR
ncbi:hypothetical protein AAY473_026685 [Plecturocebus cupreus]